MRAKYNKSGFAQKLEIRMSKSETSSIPKIQNQKRSKDLFQIWLFVLWICFGFRASDFGFLGKANKSSDRMPWGNSGYLAESSARIAISAGGYSWKIKDGDKRHHFWLAIFCPFIFYRAFPVLV